MIKDYYDILSLKRDTPLEEIKNQYKRLVLRWHPRFAKEDQKTAHFHFSQISQAYEVLSDPLKRAFYDRFGYQKLKEGLFAEGQLKGGYRFADNPDQIFERFFHQNNSLAQSVDSIMIQRGSLFGHAYGGLNYSSKTKMEDLVVKVVCNLHELYMGVAKRVTYSRRILNLDGRTTSLKEQNRLLQIRPGYGQKTSIVFKGQGHESIERISSNLIFKIVQQKHPQYTRKENDLIYLTNISLLDALNSKSLEVTTLDHRIVKVSIDEIITPKTLKEVIGEGMLNEKGERGNMYIRFNIVFPKQLSEEKKRQLRGLLV